MLEVFTIDKYLGKITFPKNITLQNMNAPEKFFKATPAEILSEAEVIAARLTQAKAICGPDGTPELIAAVLLELGAEVRWRAQRLSAANF